MALEKQKSQCDGPISPRVGGHRTYGFELFEEPRTSLNVSGLQTLREIYGDKAKRVKTMSVLIG